MELAIESIRDFSEHSAWISTLTSVDNSVWELVACTIWDPVGEVVELACEITKTTSLDSFNLKE